MQVSLGATLLFPDINIWKALLNKIVITFLMVMAIAIDNRTPDQLAGLIIGFVGAMGVWVVGNVSGVSFNPVRTIGLYVTNTIVDLFGVNDRAITILGSTRCFHRAQAGFGRCSTPDRSLCDQPY